MDQVTDRVIWVEVLTRHKTVVARHRCDGDTIRIGRAYTNDVIVDDPFVAPMHALIERDDNGTLVVRDLGTTNGVFAAHGHRRHDRLAVADDGVFRLGHTFFRVRAAEHAVAAERPIGGHVRAWTALGVLAVLVLACEALSLWLVDYGEPRAATYLVPLIGGTLLVCGWAAIWSLISRIFAGTARFDLSLIVALAGALGYEAFAGFNALGSFGLSLMSLATYSYVGTLTLLAAVCFAHLYLVNPARWAYAGGVVVVLLAAAVTTQTVMQSDVRTPLGVLYTRNLLPPSMRLAPVEDEAHFFSTVEKLRGEIDEDRSKEP